MTDDQEVAADHLTAPIAALAGAALLFGLTFVVVKDAVASFPPISFVAWRFAIGALGLMVLAGPRSVGVWRDGAIAGTLLFGGFGLQTVGLTTTGASNSALITGLYVVIVPIVVALGHRRPPAPWVGVGAVLAFIGLALLAFDETFRLGRGDLLTVVAAMGFAGHIAYLARSANRHPIIPFTAVQLLVVSLLGFGVASTLEGLVVPTGAEWGPIVLTGLGVSALAFLLQIWAQTRVPAETAAVVLTLEPIFGLLAAMVLLGERLDGRQWIGAAVIVIAIQLVLARGSGRQDLEAEAVSPAH